MLICDVNADTQRAPNTARINRCVPLDYYISSMLTRDKHESRRILDTKAGEKAVREAFTANYAVQLVDPMAVGNSAPNGRKAIVPFPARVIRTLSENNSRRDYLDCVPGVLFLNQRNSYRAYVHARIYPRGGSCSAESTHLRGQLRAR